MGFSFRADQVAELSAKLSGDAVKTRQQAGRNLSYIEAWHAIAEANRIFGFDGWNRETIELRMLAEVQREVGKSNPKPGWSVGYMAKVRVTVGDIVREGTGCGSGIDVDIVQAHESAVKEAESDAMKRALMTFGNPFGLALYDKTQEQVDREPARDIRAELDSAAAWIVKQSNPAEINRAWSEKLDWFLNLPADAQAYLTKTRDDHLATLTRKPTASAAAPDEPDARDVWTNNAIAWIGEQGSMAAIAKWWKDQMTHIKALDPPRFAALEAAKEKAKVRLSGVGAPATPAQLNRNAPIDFDLGGDRIPF